MKLKRLYPPQKSVNSLHSETGTGCEAAGCPPLRKEALLFFAGWGMDETPFMHNLPPNKDLIICYDYRSLDFDSTLLSTYDGIYVVAWSMGVWAASQVLPDSNLPLKQSIAINGTLSLSMICGEFLPPYLKVHSIISMKRPYRSSAGECADREVPFKLSWK